MFELMQRSAFPAIVPRVSDPDRELLERWRDGEPAAGEQLFERHFESLYRFFENKCRGSDTDELVQATLVACLEAKDRFRGDASFRTFLFSIARNKLLHHLRDRHRNREIDVTTTSIAEIITSVRTALARDQVHRALLDALRQLPVDEQTLVELHYWEELDTLELANVFDAPPATIRTWLFRARAKLRDLLATTAPATLDELDAIAARSRPS
jgi:RNA polymerase sigma-70 factor (ECF subfamily)